ncbi:hypothetical protein DL96DRAFT_974429 [Flagelloscypha sp. PMI_526]|nr:hypothetical protein DL96DRAFT_974429 [Flagelloscypha sp. PMI_526]
MSPTPTSFLLPSLVGSLSKPSTALLPEDVDALPISSYPRLELMLLILFLICYVTFLLRQWRYLSKRAEGKIPYEMCRQYGSTTPSLRITPPAPRLKVKVPVLHIPPLQIPDQNLPKWISLLVFNRVLRIKTAHILLCLHISLIRMYIIDSQ